MQPHTKFSQFNMESPEAGIELCCETINDAIVDTKHLVEAEIGKRKEDYYFKNVLSNYFGILN